MLEEFDTNSMRQALQRLFPYPCTSRYTAITMVPQPPGILQRLMSALCGKDGKRGLLLIAGGAVMLTVAALGMRTLHRSHNGRTL